MGPHAEWCAQANRESYRPVCGDYERQERRRRWDEAAAVERMLTDLEEMLEAAAMKRFGYRD